MSGDGGAAAHCHRGERSGTARRMSRKLLPMLGNYLHDLHLYAGTRLARLAALSLLTAMLEGAAVVLLVPMMAVATGEMTGSDLDAWFMRAGFDQPADRGLLLLVLFLGLLALRAILGWRRDVVAQDLSRGFIDTMRLRLVDYIARARWLQVIAIRRATFEHALTNDIERLSAGTELLLAALSACLLVGVQMVILFSMSPGLAMLTIALLLAGGALMLPVLARVSAIGKNLTWGGRSVHGVLGDFLEGQKLARLTDMQDAFVGRLSGALDELRAEERAYVASQAAARGWLQFSAGAIAATVLVAGAFWLRADVAVLAVLVVVLVRLTGPLQAILQAGQGMAYMLPAFAELQAIEHDLAPGTDPAAPAGPVSDPAAIGRPVGLELLNIDFAYDREPVLQGVSLRIDAGEFVALSGVSGVGKTTLLDIACGLIEPQQGIVIGGGIALDNEGARRAFRASTACIPQDPYLFDASLQENLLFGSCGASEREIEEALEAVGLESLVASLPDGLQTRAGPRGSAFSGGERQRFCLARALLRKPGLLILDEATNALDREAEAIILANLQNYRDRMTVVLVSHRDTALNHADRVIQLSAKRVAD